MGGSIMDQNSQSENLCGQCRICMDIKTNQISIFKDDLSEKIAQLADIEIHTDDGLPTSICTDCEVRLNKCYEFREEVRYADRKFREGPSYSQVDIEECVVKEEIGGYSSNYASTIDEENYNSATEVDNSENEEEQRSDEHEIEASVDPLSHVEVMDVAEQSDKTSIPEDSMGLEEPLIEARPELVPATDPLSTEMESARKETDSKPSTSTAVWQSETLRELPNHTYAADISEEGYAEKKEKLNEDVELLVACNVNDNQQLSSNIKNQPIIVFDVPQFVHSETVTDHSNLYTGPNAISNRNTQYSHSVYLPQENQLRTDFTKQISITSSHQVQVAHQYENLKSPSFNKIGIHNDPNYQLSFNNVVSYNVNPQKRNVCYNNIANESQTYPVHSVVQPSHNPVSAPLLGSIFSPIITNVVSTKLPSNIPLRQRGVPIHGTEKISTNNQFSIPVSTNFILNSKTKTGNKNLLNKNEILRPSKQTATITKKKLSHPVVVKEVSDSRCEVCNFDYGTIALLTEHKKGKSFICSKCAVSFNDHMLLEEHFTTHGSFKCSTCGLNFFSRSELIKHEKDNSTCSPQPVTCAVCKRSSKNKKTLRTHMKIRHGKDNYQCDICGTICTYPYLLKAHLKSSHTAYEHIKCELCSKIVYGPVTFKYHVLHHNMTNESASGQGCTCPKCGQTLKNKATLKIHILTHEKQSCELCGETFQGRNSLKHHKEMKHPIKGSFPCPRCDKEFTLSSDLVRHKLTQHRTKSKLKSKFCEVCGKMYKGCMKNHLLVHSGEKNFECPICKQRFNQRVTRDTHMRVHSDAGKYLCNTCGKSFRWKKTLENHVKKCTNMVDNMY